MTLATRAIHALVLSASSSWGFSTISVYQRVVNPCHGNETMSRSLKLKTPSTRIGAYRKTTSSPNEIQRTPRPRA